MEYLDILEEDILNLKIIVIVHILLVYMVLFVLYSLFNLPNLSIKISEYNITF